MERSWYWRVALIVAVALFSVWQLVPSWYYFSLPPDARNTDAYEQSVPGWAPKAKKHLNLGLDLQGGINLALGVDVDRAVKAKVARRGDELAEFLKSRNVAFESVGPGPEGRVLVVKAADPAAVQKTIEDSGYGEEMFAPAGAEPGTVRFAFREAVITDFKKQAVDQAEKTIRNRVDKWGVTEPDIKRTGDNQIRVQLPGFKDPEKARELLGRTAQLEFKITDDENPALDALRAPPAGVEGGTAVPECPGARVIDLPLPQGGCWSAETIELPGGGTRSVTMLLANTRPELEKLIQERANPLIDPAKNVVAIGEETVERGASRFSYYRSYLLRARTELSGEYLKVARAELDQSQQFGQQGRPIVTFELSPQGGQLMQKLTTENLGRRMATVLEDKVETAPYIQGVIADRGQITLGSGKNHNAMLQEAVEISTVLNGGALPAPVTISEERTVGATLGPELVRKGTVAALVGLALVLLFMVVYYRAPGMVANIALALNGLLVLAWMAMIGSTLTLPGIAGFVLTLGMAVDANVLINERIREELRSGKTVKQAVQLGYDRVFWTIFDSHVTTLVAAVVLMNAGSGPIRGFAVTLAIGLIASMFTSIVVTRAIIEFFTRHETAPQAA